MQQMAWTSELNTLSNYLTVFNQPQFDLLIKELNDLVDPHNTLPKNILTGVRRTLECIISDLNKNNLTQTLEGKSLSKAINKLREQGVISEHIISSCYNVKNLGDLGAHYFTEIDEQHQPKEALMSLITILHWYAKLHGLQLPNNKSLKLLEQETVSYELEMVGGAIPLDSKFYIRVVV